MKFIAASALISVAAATNYYGGASRIAATGLTGYNTLAAPAYSTFNTVALPAVAAVAQPIVQRVGLTDLPATYATGYTYGQAAVAPLAVQSTHQVQYRDVPSGGLISPISVDVPANAVPVNLVFRSASSQLNVQQAHESATGSFHESSSEDEAHVLKHAVTKPVIQELREVITPFRRITQEVLPVQEQINTIVARNVGTYAQKAAPATYVQQVAAPAATYVQQAAAPIQTKTLSALPALPALREAAAY